jgi:ankyrin repeat protein
LIADAVDLDGRGSFDGSALHEAARLGLAKPAKILIDSGAGLNVVSKHDLTPLMVACVTGKQKGSQVAGLLIETGADVRYIRTADKMTALMFAVKRCNPEIVQQLLDKGARLNGPRGCSQTPLMLAARANNVDSLRVLVEAGADLKGKCKLSWAQGMTAEEIAQLEKRAKALKFLRSL